MFTDPSYMVFSGVESEASANARFDRMLSIFGNVSFGKRPVVVRATGELIGYAGVGQLEFEGELRYEFGWRLVESSRGNGYATEAAEAVIAHAGDVWCGEIIAIINLTNAPSANVARKVGLEFWKQAEIDDDVADVFRLRVG
jgi:RimJ/RimL family protein N-acetyltransferase